MLENPFTSLRRAGHQAKFYIAEVCDHVPDHQEPIVLKMDLQVVGEIGALGEEDKVRKAERSRNNLIVVLFFVDAHAIGRRVAHRDRLGCERSLAAEGKCVPNILDIHSLRRKQSHITADLQEIQ